MNKKIKNFLKYIHPGYKKLYLEYDINLSPRYSFNKPHKELHRIIERDKNRYHEILTKIKKLNMIIYFHRVSYYKNLSIRK